MEEYMAMIKFFGGNFAPRGSMFCQGQILSIAANSALFSLLGTTYGGDGVNTFALPNFSGRSGIGAGQGPGLTMIYEGQVSGMQNVTLFNAQLPMHIHTAEVTINPPVNGDGPNSESPEGNYPAPTTNQTQIYNTANSGAFGAHYVSQTMLGVAGGSQPVSLANPYLGLNCIICIEGYYPSRN